VTGQQIVGLLMLITAIVGLWAMFTSWRIDVAADRIIAAIEQLKKDH
jgi:hypothetical protein